MLRRQRSIVVPLLYIGTHTEIVGVIGEPSALEFTDTDVDTSSGKVVRILPAVPAVGCLPWKKLADNACRIQPQRRKTGIRPAQRPERCDGQSRLPSSPESDTASSYGPRRRPMYERVAVGHHQGRHAVSVHRRSQPSSNFGR